MELKAPFGLTGTIVPPFFGSFKVNGQPGQRGNVTVQGGNRAVLIVQE